MLYVWKVKGFYPNTTIDFEDHYVAETANDVLEFLKRDDLEVSSIERGMSIAAVVPQ